MFHFFLLFNLFKKMWMKIILWNMAHTEKMHRNSDSLKFEITVWKRNKYFTYLS